VLEHARIDRLHLNSSVDRSLANHVFCWFMSYNYIKMHGAKTIKIFSMGFCMFFVICYSCIDLMFLCGL
jgi:hypothetical protein